MATVFPDDIGLFQQDKQSTHDSKLKYVDSFSKEASTMKTMTFILLVSLGLVCASELIIPSENRTDDSSHVQVYSRNPNCHEGWQQYGERCFRFIDTARTWAEAERFCLLQGGNLASVHSLSEYYFIEGLIVTITHGTPLTWIGGSDAQQEGLWLWSDGSRFGAFLHWGPGLPDNLNSAEHCLQMNNGGGLRWNDMRCSTTYPSVCARRVISV
ncbi:ladderlectin-like [Clupea harengus]|uniref:Ladderlectin-like n=1 Tax=Clupea harengus TaxID=7950 RepID=A0A6P8GVJ4_CLUHA|nr:ladderlectin-like [Clupea harengus]